ncbi:geranylgeranyl pyrophosphate synthetase [Colletotrichum costaricense]|uniref:Geranylgeranyl pyrophosphate synthetase n=1 Tax=Colletotrichum costaricense TaxID=1209916 RepID=A0AAI9YUT7_9PEZI|nr:geranylgeranyl pyrophosphate synthetase [Colletotrichum costaricense]KAK1525704.1 geranylgeranyl pyrophosphate synthetase [Colletotrichum costaricense]
MYRRQKHDQLQRNPRWRRSDPATTWPAPPFGPLVETVSVAELSKPALEFESTARVTGCQLVASYNWLDRTSPSIIVPGAPPRWTPLAEPRQLSEDDGVYYRDKNAARHPAHPMEPAIQAILMAHPEPSPRPVDIVACGSTIGNLLRFIRGDERPFRMLLEVVGDAVHLIRRENSPKETMSDVRGYGHKFPEAYTTWDSEVRGSTSHQRIIQYDFGGLRCLVRHEGDGYLQHKQGSSTNDTRTAFVENVSVDSLIENLKVKETAPGSPQDQSQQVQLKSGGFEVPQCAVFDLKTRSVKRKGSDFLGEELPRLWVAQIPNFILAYHDRGTFKDIEVMDVVQEVKAWETSKNPELSRLAALLSHIVRLARAQRNDRLELSRQHLDRLEIRNQCPGLSSAFSSEVNDEWAMWLAGDDTQDGPSTDGEDGLQWSDGEGDYTACSESCSYCGKCTY